MNVKHTLRIARVAVEETMAVLVHSGRKAPAHQTLQLAPGLSVQYCLNSDDRAWDSAGGSGGTSDSRSSLLRERIRGTQFDVLWMAPLITGVAFLWVRLGLAASGLWPLY